jgi:GntR family phosphonate transport system transcriptional regulator
MRPAGLLLWRRIEDTLAGEIRQRAHPAGTRLPVIEALASRFGVNRHTMRRALFALQDRGLVSIEQGRGIFVRGPMIQYPIGERTRFSDIVSPQSRTVGTRLLAARLTSAAASVAEDLQIPVESRCLEVQDLREANGVAVALNTRFFPAPRFAGLDAAIAELGSISKALRRYGVEDYTRKRTRIHARGATSEEARWLAIAPGEAVLVVEAVNVDLDGIPIEANWSRSAGGQFQLIIDQ